VGGVGASAWKFDVGKDYLGEGFFDDMQEEVEESNLKMSVRILFIG